MTDCGLDMYRQMFLIRAVEQAIQEHYLEDEMKTPMHMSMGEEAVVVGVCRALKREDQVLGTYRSHALYLSRTDETDAFFSEMYGKGHGVAKGKAGSMHLIAPEAGLICSSAVVATHIPVALGAAYAHAMRGDNRVVAAFFGDGAIDEGVFWESINFACLKKLPVLFVCEDNGYAVHSPSATRHGYESISGIVERFDCDVFRSDSTDVEEIYALAQKAVEICRGGRPCFLHLKYYRYLEHVGVFEDFKAGYRSRAEFEKWLAVDPVTLQRAKLVERIGEEKVLALEEPEKSRIQASLLKAQNDPFPAPAVLTEDLYA